MDREKLHLVGCTLEIDFKLLRQMKGDSANNCDIFLKLIIFSVEAIAIARPGRPKNLATPLLYYGNRLFGCGSYHKWYD